MYVSKHLRAYKTFCHFVGSIIFIIIIIFLI